MKKTWKVVMVSMGGTRKDLYVHLCYEEAVAFCEFFDWEACPDGGYVWDLEIEEEG